ncbi:hypothetical protein GCM10022392_29700 [Mucilaginibacter panaciglaebae]|uniref:Bulb-type lectin domain-containing protein n=2 Tax=Mucilaginibacter panaciglaebae TaxID=502331 RepID=A0ABP7X217_9SPHI
MPLSTNKVFEQGFKSASSFHGSMGEVGTASVVGNLTEITYCDNSGDERAVKEANKKDTTTYKISIAKAGNVKTVTLQDGTQSTIIDESDLIMVKAGGISAVFYKLSDANPVDPSSNGGEYLISFNKTQAEVKTIYGAGFKLECKGNIAALINWDGSYQVMITSGKASFVIDSKGTGLIAASNNGRYAVWTSDGKQCYIDNEGATSHINWSNGESQTLNNYGALSLLATKDGKLGAVYNYSKVDVTAGADGGEITQITVDKNTIPAAAKM